MVEIILYVSNQELSAAFYEEILHRKPILHVPGMTEFLLNDTCKFGLMSNNGIAKILNQKMPHPSTGNGIPRCELYLYVSNIQYEFECALNCGAKLISNIEERDWLDLVCYFSDPDGHIIAFAEKIK